MARTTIREEDITSGAVPTTGIVGVSTFTASGTWTKATREAALGVTIKRVIVEVQAGGGGGGTGDNYGGWTGGGGGYAKKLIDVSSISSSTITVGSGGAEGYPYVAGVAGGTSSWADGTNTITCTGGGGGIVINDSPATSSSNGGTATGGDINIGGSSGQSAYDGGGDSFLGFGGKYINVNENAPANNTGYGSGGGCGTSSGTTNNRNGAAGTNGIVIVTEIAG